MGSLVGQTVSHYRVLAKLGAGASGEVYKAEHLSLGIPVAVKFIHPRNLEDPHTRVRFAREARAAAILDHASICKVFDYAESDACTFIVMDFIDGVTLRGMIERGPLPLVDAVAIAVQVAEGLQQAHGHGLVHRDLKPANVMITCPPAGLPRAKILDFGVVCDAAEQGLTQTGAVVGTAGYMAPEQALGRPVDPRTDLWALGVCLYEMVTGRTPFAGEYGLAVQYAVVHAQPPAVGMLRPEAPPELRRIINKALNKAPADRYQDAAEMLADLRALQRDLAVESPRFAAWVWTYRNRLALGVGAVAALALLLALAGTVWRPQPADNPFARGRTRQLTYGPGCEAEPSLSPDGKFLAFTAGPAGNRDVWWLGLAGGDPVRVTDDPADDRDPAWLADGSGIVFCSLRDGRAAVWQTDLTGRATRLLVEDADQPALSPDGTRIAFTRADAAGNGRIAVAPLADPDAAVLVTGDRDGYWDHRDPTWSPDSRSICYADFHNLWEVPAAGGPARQLTTDNGWNHLPVYTPGGNAICFESLRDATASLWRLDLADGRQVRLTPGSGHEGHPSLDRSGTRLVYTTAHRDDDVVVADRRTGTTATIGTAPREFQPAISGDGTLLAYVSPRWSRYGQLWLRQLQDGGPVGEPIRLVAGEHSVAFPTISPDNRWIAYYQIRRESRSRNLWIVPIKPGRPQAVTVSAGADIHPAWSPDGRRLAYSSEREGTPAIHTIAVADGRAVGDPFRVTPPGLPAQYPCWSPDGTVIAFQGRTSQIPDVWVVPADGSAPPRQLTHAADVYHLAWIRERNELWACGRWGGTRYEVRRVDPAGGAPAPLDPPWIMDDACEIPLIGADDTGRMAVWVVTRHQGNLWILETPQEGGF
ncbi:MAG: protein kinase [Candidatus Krumholzibacteriia bacterium]